MGFSTPGRCSSRSRSPPTAWRARCGRSWMRTGRPRSRRLSALCFAEAGSRVAVTGGPYAYVEVAFGRFAGFLAGVLVWLLGTLAVAAVSTIFADSIGALAPRLDGAAPRAFLLVAIFLLLGGVNILGVRQGVLLNAVATVA